MAEKSFFKQFVFAKSNYYSTHEWEAWALKVQVPPAHQVPQPLTHKHTHTRLDGCPQGTIWGRGLAQGHFDKLKAGSEIEPRGLWSKNAPWYHLSHSCNHSFTPFVLLLTVVSAKETENQSRQLRLVWICNLLKRQQLWARPYKPFIHQSMSRWCVRC